MSYEHECRTCGNKWTGERMIERCPKCGSSVDGTGISKELHNADPKRKKYDHECRTCGNKWTDTIMIERCPKCGSSIDGTKPPGEHVNGVPKN